MSHRILITIEKVIIGFDSNNFRHLPNLPNQANSEELDTYSISLFLDKFHLMKNKSSLRHVFLLRRE